MKRTEIPSAPARTVESVSHVLCDLCGVQGTPGYRGEVEWPSDRDETDRTETTVMIRSGYAWPEGGHWDQRSWHICPECFREELISLFEKVGAKPTVEGIDW